MQDCEKKNKKRIKKVIYMLLLFLGVTFFSSCAAPKTSDNNQFIIVTTFYPVYIATINITKDIPDVLVINITKPQTGCLHDYSLNPTDMQTLAKAKVFVINGAGMESFMDKVIQGFPRLQVINASEQIELLQDPSSNELNPHVWVSVSGAILQLDNIVTGLCAIDPLHRQLYQDNANSYREKLESLRNKMHMELEGIKTKEIITFHEAFPYFAREFNLKIIAVIEREPGSEPSPKELINLIQTIRKMPTKVLFVEPQYAQKAADIIRREAGASIFELDPAVTGDGSLDSYLQIMERNLVVLKKALS